MEHENNCSFCIINQGGWVRQHKNMSEWPNNRLPTLVPTSNARSQDGRRYLAGITEANNWQRIYKDTVFVLLSGPKLVLGNTPKMRYSRLLWLFLIESEKIYFIVTYNNMTNIVLLYENILHPGFYAIDNKLFSLHP